MDRTIYLKRADTINDRLLSVYRECFDELMNLSKESGLRFLVLTGTGIELPNILFEHDYGDRSTYTYEGLESVEFCDTENYITLRGKDGGCAYMDSSWGEYFDVAKIGDVYKAVMTVVGRM